MNEFWFFVTAYGDTIWYVVGFDVNGVRNTVVAYSQFTGLTSSLDVQAFNDSICTASTSAAFQTAIATTGFPQ